MSDIREAKIAVLHEALDFVDSRETFQRKLDALIAAVRAENAALPPRPNFGPETDTWEDRGYPGPPVCRCGHERDQHGSRTEQRDGQKVYVQKCEQCPCEVFVERDGPLSQLIDSFGPIQRYGTVGNVIRTTEGEPGYEAERRQQEKERPMSDKFPALQSMKANAEVIVRRHAALHAPKVEARDVDAICRALGEISVDEATAALDRVQREGR